MPNFVDPESGGPLPGQEDHWSLVTQYRVRLAQEEREWDKAERLQQTCVDWSRQCAAPILVIPRASLDSLQRHTVRNLAVALEGLGYTRRELAREDCVAIFEEALDLSESIGDRTEVAICAFNLGHAYMNVVALRDLQQAEYWYRHSLELMDETDRMGFGKCLAQLGYVAFGRFKDSREQQLPNEELVRHMNEAASFYDRSIEYFPPDAVGELGLTHNQLGEIYRSAGDAERAVVHFRHAIHYREKEGNLYEASGTRSNVALALLGTGRPQDALEYARAALRGFESYGESAADKIQRTQKVIKLIEQQL